jgi:hypothetical protein
MRNGKIHVCLLLLFLAFVFSSAGASPLATQTARIGPYRLLLSFYSLPRTGQQLNMTIQPATSGVSLRFSQAVLNPAPGTDATPVGAAPPDSKRLSWLFYRRYSHERSQSTRYADMAGLAYRPVPCFIAPHLHLDAGATAQCTT